MVEEKFELRKIRSFGENITDTFTFVRMNFYGLVKCYFAICGIFLFILAIGTGLVGDEFRKFLRSASLMAYTPLVSSGVLTKEIFFVMLPSWLALVSVGVMVNAFMYCYDSQPTAPSLASVWKVFRKYFLRVLLNSIPVTLLILGGTIFCVVPGIYFAVVLTNYICISVMEDVSLGTMFNRCFTLIRGSFWPSLGIYLVIYLIAVLGQALPFGIITTVGLNIFGRQYPVLQDLLLAVLSVFRLIFYILPMISVTLNYFTLAERVDGLGLIRRRNRRGRIEDTQIKGPQNP